MSIPWRAAQLNTDEFRPGRLAISTAATPESLLANWLNSRRAGKPCGVCSQDKTVYSSLSEMLRDAANNLCKVRSQGNRSAWLCKRFIGSGKHLIDNIRITLATLDTLQTNAGLID